MPENKMSIFIVVTIVIIITIFNLDFSSLAMVVILKTTTMLYSVHTYFVMVLLDVFILMADFAHWVTRLLW